MGLAKRRGPARVHSATSPETAKLTGHAKPKLMLGGSNHQVPWCDGVCWHGLSIRASNPADCRFFQANPQSRYHVRQLDDWEATCTSRTDGPTWVIVIRSRHDHSWNTVAFPFHSGSKLWDEPQSEDYVLDIVGRLNPRVMVHAALLAISYRYVAEVFSGFDRGVRDT